MAKQKTVFAMGNVTELELISINSNVKLAEDVYGVVVAIQISGKDNVTYDVGWWSSRSYEVKTFAPQQIEAVASTTNMKIGFV